MVCAYEEEKGQHQEQRIFTELQFMAPEADYGSEQSSSQGKNFMLTGNPAKGDAQTEK